MTHSCLACGNSAIKEILNFGPQPAANLLSAQPGESVRREKLALSFCDACGHAQQSVFYPNDELFGHYLYQSGTSGALKTYFDWLAQCVATIMPVGGQVLELASNDGSFLQALADHGVTAEGVEPAGNIVELSRAKGHKVTHGFWPEAKVEGIFDMVIAMNVAAHTPDPFAFMKGVKEVLKPAGVAFIQASQADMFRNFEFDTLYHEHYSFYCPSSMTALARRAGFTHARFVKSDIHGGSLIGLFSEDEATLDRTAAALRKPPFYLEDMDAAQRPTLAEAESFSTRARETCDTVRLAADMAHAAGRKVVMVGAAAKAITMMQASGVNVDYVVDEAPLKIGLYIAGTDLKIDTLTSVAEIKEPTLFIIGAWNFKQQLDSKLKNNRKDAANDISVAYFPRFTATPI